MKDVLMEKFNYYIVFQYKGGVGGEYLHRSCPLDNENELTAEHERLEREFGRPVVILDWKRID
jgi:hypothetical protein